MKQTNYRDTLKGVSTLDIMKKIHITVFFLLVFFAFAATVFGRFGHSTLDLVDPSFNPQIQTNSYASKWVSAVHSLPDGKILVLGNFNIYNGVSVGKFVRLNPNGSLDTSFNNRIVTGVQSQTPAKILIQPDGKIILSSLGLSAGGQSQRSLLRLNADGTLDATFNYSQPDTIHHIVMDSLNRLWILGHPANQPNARRLFRLSPNGSVDNSFNAQIPMTISVQGREIALQGNKIVVSYTLDYSNITINRLNEDGSRDSSFTPATEGGYLVGVQPNNKILYSRNGVLSRLNENGGIDNTYQTTAAFDFDFDIEPKFTSDGKLIISTEGIYSTFKRYLPNGGIDPAFNQYTAGNVTCYTLQPDNGIVVGDGSADASPTNANDFIRITPAGNLDTTFNSGGTGFLTLRPGIIEAIETQTDGKILLGGRFDLINGVSRIGFARLNSDSTVDTTFRINMTSGSGNYFSFMGDVYQIRVLADGKILLSGWFEYVLNGANKVNLVRLNPDGSIDPSFDMNYRINDYSQVNGAGQNRFVPYGDGRIIVGTSRLVSQELIGPIRFLANGTRDTSFNSMLNASAATVYIHDISVQPDGKILVSGQAFSDPVKSFIVRFNADGSLDSTFLHTGESSYTKSRLALLPNGKILYAKYSANGGSAGLQRLNLDGSIDTSFNQISLADTAAKINALLVLPNGKIFIGGTFNLSINGRTTKNLVQLSENGNIESTVYDLNNEVLSLASDADGRVLVGGGFTVIGANGENASRSYVARLTGSTARFDFDGDGRSDLSAFTLTNGKWAIRNSGSNQLTEMFFGMNGDNLTAADYDGDGKADVAVYRPSNGVWYLWRSRDGFAALQWGLAEDKPVAADFDGDGKADIANWRPSNGVWYVRQSSNDQLFTVQFGQTGDIPLIDADFDGDGKADIAVWRPSNGVFYWLASGANYQFRAVQFGQSGDVPTSGDFNGDGKTDLVVFRPTEGNWYQYLTQSNGSYSYSGYGFGMNGDEPIAADYDGDGKTDVAVRRGNIWHINRSNQGYVSVLFAAANDLAVPSSLIR